MMRSMAKIIRSTRKVIRLTLRMISPDKNPGEWFLNDRVGHNRPRGDIVMLVRNPRSDSLMIKWVIV